VRVWCDISPIPLLFAAVLHPRTTPRDPLGILHIVAFVTLCENYMGIEPHFDLWNHIFRIRLLQGSDAEVAVLGGVDIFVKFRHRVDP
jgi:hypothetical protein